ncbi:MAG: transposase, partial [Candidatus Omnitrophica bacterium]|nr:transposase [Candidatus Omnitrophota bacterium]
MPRLPRIHISNALYYITANGNLGENIFLDEKDYAMYAELLKKYKEQYGFRLFSFCLIPGTLSLLFELKGEEDSVSMVMHDINSSYTRYFNGRYNRRGHLFRERFKSVIVEKGPYLAKVLRYIHQRPRILG